MTYMRNPESDLPNFYCEFVMVLGFFGILVIFVGYGLMSKRFRHGLRGKKSAMAAKYKVVKDVKLSPTSLSRPSTSASIIDTVRLPEILYWKQKLDRTFNFNKQDVIDFTKFSKMTMCRASEANS